MSFDEQPDDPHGECRHEIKRLQGRIVEVEAERDQQLKMSEQLARERVAEAAHRKRAEARAEQAERDRERIREAWSEVTADRNRIKATADAISGDDYWGWLGDGDDDLETMSDGMQVRITAGCLRGVIEEAKSTVDPLPEGARLEGVGVRTKRGAYVYLNLAGFVVNDPTERGDHSILSDEWAAADHLRAVLSRAKGGAGG